MNPFEQQPEKHFALEDDGHPLVGGESITSSATRTDDRLPDGSINMEPARHRGWLDAMTRAYGRKDAPTEERQQNVKAIVEGAVEAGVPKDLIQERLEELGITVTRKE